MYHSKPFTHIRMYIWEVIQAVYDSLEVECGTADEDRRSISLPEVGNSTSDKCGILNRGHGLCDAAFVNEVMGNRFAFRLSRFCGSDPELPVHLTRVDGDDLSIESMDVET